MYVPGTDTAGLQVDLGGLRFNAVDSAGVAWRIAADGGLAGWDGPAVRGDWTEREADHGAWAPTVYLGARPITIAGTIIAPDRPALDDAMERLRTAVGLGDTVLTVYETVPKRAVVRRSGQLLIQYVTDRIASYSLMVTAADPRRYAVDPATVVLSLPMVSGGLTFPLTFPMSIPATVAISDSTVTNDGTIESRPTITIAGPVSQPQVTVTGPDGVARTLLYSGDIAAGDWLALDTDAHTVLYNGLANRRALLTGPWAGLPPGDSGVAFRAGAYSAAATCTITYRSAWM